MSVQISNERRSSTARQSSRCIKTDDTRDPINTIHSILCNLSETIRDTNRSRQNKKYESNESLNDDKIHVIKPPQPRAFRNRSKVVVTKVKNLPRVPSKTSTSVLTITRSRRNVKKSTTLTTSPMKELLEIYRNQAAKESYSSNIAVPKRIVKNPETTAPIPPLTMNYDENTDGLRNYELPTVSSRLKRVAKYYMTKYNFKNIPFCQTMSTGRSHNIGINIQQFMSMVKNKQTAIEKLSPSLIYNITLAVGSMNEPQMSSMFSNLTSKTTHCPLFRSRINYQHLKEQAKSIPEEDDKDEDDEENRIDTTDTQSLYITGPSGDIKVRNCKRTSWIIDNDQKKCTCVPKEGVEFRQILNRYSTTTNVINKEEITKRSTGNPVRRQNQTEFENKKKNLEECLHKLHDEFEMMNKKYDELTGTSSRNLSEEMKKEINELDKKLCQKEHDVKRIMSIYEEALLLKQQTKDSKQNTKNTGVERNRTIKNTNSLNEPKSTTSILDKLLKQVQQLQTKRA